MNNVIRFRPANSRRRMASDDCAQILFFTGVRYHRMSEDACVAASEPPRARRKRQDGEAGGKRKSRG